MLSSKIEGTQSSLSDLLLFEHDEAPGVPVADTRESFNYIRAMNHGLARVRDGFPLSLRLLKEIHGLLLESGRGASRAPGQLRSTQNWIGGTHPGNARYVPPPAHEVLPAMGALEKFLHNDPVRTSVLVRPRWPMRKFETIHPFLDGNGRLGRLLITLLLCVEEQRGHVAAASLSEPLLEVEPRRVLRSAPTRPDPRRMGRVASILPGGRQRRWFCNGDNSAPAGARRRRPASDPQPWSCERVCAAAS